MAIPEFSKQTIDVLARRARFQCSNPDCGVHTVGPNSEPDKSTTIGEAAHIHGAMPCSMRYDPMMSDVTRAAITNGIWLCRNCHGQVDRDAAQFPAELLFVWRKEHESRVQRELGTRGDRIRHEVEMERFEFLAGYPQIIQRIAMDKPDGWEWRFAAELLRYLNRPEFKRLQNLRSGHYYRQYPQVRSADFLEWVTERTHVMSNLVPPLSALFDRLTASFGTVGESGEIEDIFDTCILIRDMLAEMVRHEEVLRFTGLPTEGEEIRAIFVDAIGCNAERLIELPQKLDEAIALIGANHGGTREAPLVVTWTVFFDVPDDFNRRFDEALSRYEIALFGNLS